MLARKFASYRLHMAWITQNNQKCLIFIGPSRLKPLKKISEALNRV